MKQERTLIVRKVEAGNKNVNPAYFREFEEKAPNVVTYEAMLNGAEIRITDQAVGTAPRVGQNIKIPIEWEYE